MTGSRVLGLVLAIAAGANWALAADIVDNGDFALGLDLWDTTRSGGGSHTIEVLDTFEGYTDVLHLKRTYSGADGGRQSVTQVFSTSPSECIAGTAKLTARFKVKSHNLHNSGWWAREHGGLGEYPLHFKIYSQDSWCIWNLGLLGYENSQLLTNYQKVPLNTWIEQSITVPLQYYTLTRVDICTAGWDRDVYVDYIKIEPMH